MQTLPVLHVLGGVAVGSHSLPSVVDEPQTKWLPEEVVTDLQSGNLSAAAQLVVSVVPVHEM